MRGIGVTHAFADISGMAFDRIFMLTETDGTLCRTPVSADGEIHLRRFMTACT